MKFPNQLQNRAAVTIAQTARLVATAHQRLNTIGSQVSALTPGDWEALALEAGWSNVSGYIPAQVRIQQNGVALLVGHIQGGTVTNGTVIATLDTGYYNPVHAHSFTANVLAGASSVSVAGTVSGSSDDSGLADGTVGGSAADSGIADGSVSGTAADSGVDDGTVGGSTDAVNGTVGTHAHSVTGAIANGHHTHSVSGAIGSGHHTHSVTGAVANGHHTHGSSALAPSTPVNYNTVILSLSTSGVLTIQNCSSAATQLSFNETLPLVTS